MTFDKLPTKPWYPIFQWRFIKPNWEVFYLIERPIVPFVRNLPFEQRVAVLCNSSVLLTLIATSLCGVSLKFQTTYTTFRQSGFVEWRLTSLCPRLLSKRCASIKHLGKSDFTAFFFATQTSTKAAVPKSWVPTPKMGREGI